MSRPTQPVETVACPRCHRKQPKQGPDTIYWCNHCQCAFDDTPEEGGDYDDRDPSRRIQREEAAVARRMERGRRR